MRKEERKDEKKGKREKAEVEKSYVQKSYIYSGIATLRKAVKYTKTKSEKSPKKGGEKEKERKS